MLARPLIVMTAVLLVLGAGRLSAAPADAAAIVKASGIHRGLCVHLDVTDGVLTAKLADESEFVVHGIATTAEATRKARLRWDRPFSSTAISTRASRKKPPRSRIKPHGASWLGVWLRTGGGRPSLCAHGPARRPTTPHRRLYSAISIKWS